MSIKKYTSGSWVDIPYRKYETATDTLTSLPADVIADGQSASANIIGNMVQTGTPSPSSIIMPDECGNKTANLFYKKMSGANIDAQGKIITNSEFDMVVAKVTEGETYSVSGVSGVMGFFVSEPELGSRSYNNARDIIVSPVTIPQGVNYVAYRVSDRPNVAMLNIGQTALPYQPYGYKIPISSGGTTTNVYLGEVQSTRQIKKLVLTGDTNINKNTPSNPNDFLYYLSVPHVKTDCICSHLISTDSFPSADTGGIYSKYIAEILYINLSRSVMEAQPSGNTIAGFKEYLAAQYSNGTPVTVWYVLAESTTGIVNEPIRKIGDYADSVSVSNLPTTGTAEQFNIDTDLKPSEVDLTYHGWHEHSDTKF